MKSGFDPKPPKPPFLNTIQGKLILCLCALLFPILLTQAYIYHDRFHARRAEELQANLELARAVVKSFDMLLQDILSDELVLGTALTSSRPLPRQDQDRLLAKAKTGNPAVWHLFWVNPAGRVLASTVPKYMEYDLTDRPYFRKILDGQDFVVSELILSKDTGRPTFTISRGIRDDEGELQGIVVAGIELDQLQGVLGIERSQDAGVSIIDNKGMLVYRYPGTESTWEQRNWLASCPWLNDALRSREVLIRADGTATSKKQLVACTPIPSIGWVALASRSEDDVLESAYSLLQTHAMLFLFIALAAFGFGLLGSSRISGSVRRLRDHVLGFGRGENLILGIPSGIAELDDLAAAFGNMAEDIRKRECERKRTEDALRESEEKLHSAFANAAIGFAITTPEGRFLDVNPAYSELTGYSREELCNLEFPQLVHPDDLSDNMRLMELMIAGEIANCVIENRYLRKDGGVVFVRKSVSIVRAEGVPRWIIVLVEDISERKLMEKEILKSRDELEARVQERTEELQSANEKLQSVPPRLIEIQENERRRLASDLHDSIGQTLAALKFRIEHIANTVQKGDSREALKLLNEFVPILQRSIDETRTIYMGLRPTILADHGILATLEWYRQQLLGIYPGQHIEIETTISEEDIPENLKTAMFRIIQEALNNTCKHSRAEWVDVRLALNEGSLELEISDDGIGMDLDYILESSTAKSLGLISMRERAELTGGELYIRSMPDKGTTVKAVWPVQAEITPGGRLGIS